MKKYLLGIFAMAALIGLQACGGDDRDESTTIIHANLITVTQGETPFMSDGLYKYEVNNVSGKMDLTLTTTFNKYMPEVTMVIKDITLRALVTGIVKFNVTSVVPQKEDGTPYSDYTITDLIGVIDQINGIQTIRYKVVSEHGTTQVFSTSSLAFSALSENDGYVYINASTNEIYPNGTFCRFAWNTGQNLVNLSMFNVKFAEKMPIQLWIEIPSIKAETTNTGYILSANEVIPNSLDMDGQRTPMEKYKITNLTGEVNFITGDCTIEFDCFGMHFKNEAGNEANLNDCKNKLAYY